VFFRVFEEVFSGLRCTSRELDPGFYLANRIHRLRANRRSSLQEDRHGLNTVGRIPILKQQMHFSSQQLRLVCSDHSDKSGELLRCSSLIGLRRPTSLVTSKLRLRRKNLSNAIAPCRGAQWVAESRSSLTLCRKVISTNTRVIDKPLWRYK
jgi:hypothetical protein